MPVEKITTRQIIGFIIITRLSFALSSMPIIDHPPNNQDLWISVVISIAYLLVFSTPLIFLANNFKAFSMISYIKKIYGKRIGGFLGILYGLYFIINTINSLTLQTELVCTSILADSSNIIIAGAMMITCIYIVSLGAITILRGSEIFFPLITIVFLILVLFGLNNVDLKVLLPILKDSTLLDINKGAIELSFIFTDVFLLLMIIPELENKRDINKIFLISTTVSLLLLIVALVVTQGSLGIELSKHTVFPFYKYTRLINLLEIFERIDAIFVFVWILASIARILGFTYISIRAFRDVFNKKEDEKSILYVVGAIIFIVSISIIQRRSVIGIRKDFDFYMNILYIIFYVTIPVITCIIYFFRRKTLR